MLNSDLFKYADDQSVSVKGKELSMVSYLLQSEGKSPSVGFLRMHLKLIQVNNGIIFKRNEYVPDFNVFGGGKYVDICKSMTVLLHCIDLIWPSVFI